MRPKGDRYRDEHTAPSLLPLGHTQVATTARYAHLDNDPLRRASEAIGGQRHGDQNFH